ncbi:histone H3-like centromeric protein A isoform X2 [Ooceraea biroi]|uniref:histone H3-like centromeric protein A isoform X2 n=1 Tax=Ooceraea biroi TaxID=2015173 RepID=UPI0005B81FAB|nr:histone H3-like centromeric protein A isoform X2 [Ooceraea biroi]
MVRRKREPTSFSERMRNEKGKRSEKRTTVLVDKRKRKSRVLQEIKHLRKTTHFLIPKMPFARVVREIFLEIFPRQDIRRLEIDILKINLKNTSDCT